MSNVDEMFDNLTDEQIEALTGDPQSEPHIVVGIDRFITVPESLKRIAVQFDHDVETVTFDCPRYWDGLDMSKMPVRVSYMRADGYADSCITKNVTIDVDDETIMHFDWTISRNVTEVKGELSFLVCVKKTDDEGQLINHWNSELNKDMYISAGLDCEESILNAYPDIVTQVLLASERANDISQTLEEHYRNGDFELGLPIVNENHNGRILRVSDGVWTADELLIFDGGTVEELNNSAFIRYSANADGSDFTAEWTIGQCYIGVATATSAPTNASAYTWIRMIAPLDQNMYGNAFTETVSGEIIRVDDVSPIPHTVKAKVSSKNLISQPFSNASMTANGVTFTDNGDGSITINGTATANAEFMFRNMVKMQSGTYKYSLFGTEDISGVSGNVQKRTTGGSWVANLSNTKSNDGIFTLTDADMEYLYGFNLYIISGTVLNNVIVKPQLEVGTETTAYTPHIKPSNVTVRKCGKNLWSYRPSVVQDGVTITTDENGRIRYSGTCASSFVIYSTISLPAGTYTLSDRASRIVTNSADARTQVYIPSTGFDARIYWDSPLNGSVTFTLTEPSNDVRLRIKGAVGVNFDGYSIMPQLEVGSKMTEYEPHTHEDYTPEEDGTVDIHSVDPTMTLYANEPGVGIEATYNRDSNRILDYIDKNVITASATLKDNGAYTLTFEKGVRL